MCICKDDGPTFFPFRAATAQVNLTPSVWRHLNHNKTIKNFKIMFSYDKGLGISIDPATALVSSGASFITFCTKCVVTAVQGPEPETTGDAGAV